jgi:hypothetical protein
MEIIQESNRNDYIMQANIAMLPHIENKERKEFFDMLSMNEDKLSVEENQKTDFEAIKKAKEKLKMM